MGIQINGVNDIISATDGSLSLPGADLTNLSQVNVTGVGTFANLVVIGNVSIAGTLTYEDVTNVDSIGIVTARSGVRIDAGGIVVVGVTTVAAGTAALPSISPTGDSNTGIFFPSADTIAFAEGGAEAARFDSSGRFGIGTASPQRNAHFNSSTTEVALKLTNSTSGSGTGDGTDIKYEGLNLTINNREAGAIYFETSNSLAATIDSSGRLLVGTSSSPSLTDGQYSKLHVIGNTNSASGDGLINIGRGALASSGLAGGTSLGNLQFTDSAGAVHAVIGGQTDGTTGTNDYPGRIVLATTADGASSPTERMRIGSDGTVYVGTTSDPGPGGNNGIALIPSGELDVSRNSGTSGIFNRNTNDGAILDFRQDNISEGNISVSGSTVSYNGAHLSRWSQLPGGAERTEILRGSVLSNLDEMCEWGEEDNEQLNRMKVSDVEGDKNVSGVFQAWDDDDDTYTNDFYCAMTGDFIIRIAEGVIVERGDLLMSAGDGTAKPQGDGFVQDKTIAKVTSTNVSCTYEDGSYCVPCVLMAC
jgi:hypothetical protein